MADIPDQIVLKRDRDLEGRAWHFWLRHAILIVLFGGIAVAALLNVFGQRPTTTNASAPEATLSVYAPTHVRPGLIWQARFHIDAHQDLKNAIVVLGPGWLESMTVNTIEPSPVGEASDDGKLSLELGHIPAGDKYLLFMQFQVNPTNVGSRTRTIELYDDKTRLLGIDQTVTIFP